MPVKSFADRRAVIATFTPKQPASFQQILAALGPDWAEPKRVACLRQLLRKMERDRHIIRIDRNTYFPLRSPRGCGMGSAEETVSAAVAIVEEADGKVPLAEIVSHLAGDDIWGADERVKQRSSILEMMKASGRFKFRGDTVSLLPISLPIWAS